METTDRQRQLTSLISKLNGICHDSLDEAARTCIARSNYGIEIEHWLCAILNQPDADLKCIFDFFEIDEIYILLH